jgi:formylglycine-generating enzyme required for sulfatase activity/dienelactone hydrolase
MIRSLAVGTKLGRYTLIAPLGSGGMGVVYRARDEKLERDVALKIVAPGVLAGDDARHRFRREARALAKLSHAHIAAIYDVGEEDGIDYIVMECVTGESLAEKLRSGALPVKEATTIALQIAEALEEAHAEGVIHRDLKPANVMITARGQVKILDFGIAKLLAPEASELTVSAVTEGLIGTPLYMSPEQASEKPVDPRSDLWSLGAIYYETLTGRTPFHADSHIAVLRSITEREFTPIDTLRQDVPQGAAQIVARALTKDVANRYQTAAEIAHDSSELLAELTRGEVEPAIRISRARMVAAAIVLLATAGAGLWLYHRASRRTWAREQAIPEIGRLLEEHKPLAAFLILRQAERYLPSDPQVKQMGAENTIAASIASSPSGAKVEIEDYSADGAWFSLGETPLTGVRIPKGYFRWRVSKPGTGEMLRASDPSRTMNFPLDATLNAPSGMVPVPAGSMTDYVGFVGWVGPYELPSYFVDRFEVTNSEYQKFVDSGGYEKREYWHEPFRQAGRELAWSDAMAQFRDTTGRAGPSTWAGGHYPEGAADLPVAGVSWFEASAYAAYAGKQLPALAQWFQVAPPDDSASIVSASNLSGSNPKGDGLARVGQYKGLGPYGTYDTAGNVREWVLNPVDGGLRFILGGAWKSPLYLYSSPEEASPFDRSETNGFRCVRNPVPLAAELTQEIKRTERDFTRYKPVSDAVFNAYKLLYAYPNTPLNAKADGVVKETIDWREEKVEFDTGYRGERMSAYLFLPKNAHPPYQTILFFPSARVSFLPGSADGHELGDIKFFDYILQSGRAVMYPVYQDTYERQSKLTLPSGSQNIEVTTDRYKDAARSLDYLATRTDIDSSRMAYLGVSMGSAEGAIITALMQDRLKCAVFLDGGYFMDPPPPGGDQADFVTRMKKPVLMVNGRYDFTFSVDRAQNPFFSMLGTPPVDKSHVLLDTPHDVTEQRPQLVKAVLDWLDRYMGRVDN